MKIKTFLFLAVSLVLSSCKTKQPVEDLGYMKNIEQVATDASLSAGRNTLQKGDHVVILVSGKDLDVVKPFNQNYSSSEIITNAQAGGNATPQVQPVSGPTYVIDDGGLIQFPVVGSVQASGKTVDELRDDLRARIKRYIIDPTVSVRLTNYKITVLGEVARPGQYTIPDGQSTLLNALGLAGDLTMYGKRDDVLVVRNTDGVITKEHINLGDASFINSPYYNLKQGDVIYVSPNPTRAIAARQNPNTGLYISIASVTLGLLGLLVTVFKK